VDDEPNKNEPRRIKRILENAGFECELREPPKFGEIANLTCDVFITDLNLAQAQLDEMVYSGKTLSSEYRSNFPSTPIVLITQKEIIAAKARNIRTDNTDLDLIWYKRDAWEQKERFIEELRSLISGFKALSNTSLNWDTVKDLMQTVNEAEFSELREANPPIQRANWTVSEIAEWIRCVVLEFPGVLLNDKYAAVRLGIDPEDFATNPVLHDLFEDAKYKGIFHEFGRRWWKDRLIEIASDFLLDNDQDTKPLVESFALTFHKAYGTKIKQATCIWDEQPIADTICYIYQQPVKLRNSLHYRPDNRPASMEPARVSRKAIVGSNDFDELLLDPGSVETARKWMKGE
ncbi:MAG: hypothetical protein AAFY41_18240, partial [Bacteroidota bacterium]